MLYLLPNPGTPGMEKKAMLTISSVLISSRESGAWLWEEGRKEETRIYKCPGHAGLVLDSTARNPVLCFPKDRR